VGTRGMTIKELAKNCENVEKYNIRHSSRGQFMYVLSSGEIYVPASIVLYLTSKYTQFHGPITESVMFDEKTANVVNRLKKIPHYLTHNNIMTLNHMIYIKTSKRPFAHRLSCLYSGRILGELLKLNALDKENPLLIDRRNGPYFLFANGKLIFNRKHRYPDNIINISREHKKYGRSVGRLHQKPQSLSKTTDVLFKKQNIERYNAKKAARMSKQKAQASKSSSRKRQHSEDEDDDDEDDDTETLKKIIKKPRLTKTKTKKQETKTSKKKTSKKTATKTKTSKTKKPTAKKSENVDIVDRLFMFIDITRPKILTNDDKRKIKNFLYDDDDIDNIVRLFMMIFNNKVGEEDNKLKLSESDYQIITTHLKIKK